MWNRIVGIQRFNNEDFWRLMNEEQTDKKYLKKSSAISKVLEFHQKPQQEK